MMAKITIETKDGQSYVYVDDDATIYSYANAMIRLLHYTTFTEKSIEDVFGTTYFDDGE